MALALYFSDSLHACIRQCMCVVFGCLKEEKRKERDRGKARGESGVLGFSTKQLTEWLLHWTIVKS